MAIRAAMAVIAATTSGATSKPSWAANRAARIIRNGSSPNDSSGGPGVRSRRRTRSSRPPNGSTKVSDGSSTAIALTVKSRRRRSSSRLVPNATSGLRDAGS